MVPGLSRSVQSLRVEAEGEEEAWEEEEEEGGRRRQEEEVGGLEGGGGCFFFLGGIVLFGLGGRRWEEVREVLLLRVG